MSYLKTPAYRNPALLRLANGAPCMHCGAEDGTVVAAHANSQALGKGLGRKASDAAIAYLCHTCHAVVDQGSLSGEVRFGIWAMAHARTFEWLLQTGKLKVSA